MKKIKIISIVVLIISIVIFGAYKIYEKMNKDNTPPVISCDTEEILASVAITEEELLEGVTASDNISGDVTDTVVIENISAFVEENTRIITYAAIDEKSNVGRMQRTLKYTDYETPTFSLAEPLRIPMGKTMDLLGSISAESILDGDLSDKVKYTLESTIDVGSTGVYQVEFRVTDSCGYVEYLPLEVEVYDRTEERISVELSDYLIYLPLNAEFNAEDYYVGSDIEGELEIQSEVDTTTAGIYNVDYIVNGNSSMGKTRLVVVVKES